METRRIVLANESRLMRKMLKCVIDKSPSLKVVGETRKFSEVIRITEKHNAHWVVVSLSSRGDIPEQINDLPLPDSSVSILAISNKGEKVKIRWVDHQEQTFIDCSLKDMLTALHE